MPKLKVGDEIYCYREFDRFGTGCFKILKVGREYYHCSNGIKIFIKIVEEELNKTLTVERKFFKTEEEFNNFNKMKKSINRIMENIYKINFEQFEKIQKILEEV